MGGLLNGELVTESSRELENAPARHKGMQRGATFGPGGMPITIEALNYSVRSNNPASKQKQACLLSDVTAHFAPRRMAALMGPSGSGKTTLLDLLAGRKTVGDVQGSIRFAGHKPSRQFLRRYTGYVEQFDTLLPMLTVEEMLLYTAELKRPWREPLCEKRDDVDMVLDRLALTSCRSLRIGDPLSKGISGGQAKRVNIGIALITNPRVLFLDEPTSGLDSFTANEVMTVVKGLVKDGVTIVATIHSPTAYAYSLFDSLLMLVRGQVVYFGAAGTAPLDAVASLRTGSPGATLHTALTDEEGSTAPGNPAEWLVDLFTRAEREGCVGEFVQQYAGSALKQSNDAETAQLAKQQRSLPVHVQAELAVRRETVTPWWWGLRTLIKFRMVRSYTSPAFLIGRTWDKLIMGLLLTTLYLGLGKEMTTGNVANISSVLFMWTTLPAFGAVSYVPTLVLERGLYVRERNDGLYSVTTYLLSKLTDELVIMAAFSLAISGIVWLGVGLQGSFLIHYLAYSALVTMSVVLAYFVAAVSPTIGVANTILPFYVTTLLFFSGFLIRLHRMPQWWYWYSVINPLRYAFAACMINQFSAERNLSFLNGTSILSGYGFDGESAWANLGILYAFIAAFTVCTWLALRFKRYQKR